MSLRRIEASLTGVPVRGQTWLTGKRKLTQLAELTVREDESSQSAQAFEGLVAMLLGRVLIHGSIGCGCICTSDLLSLPDEVLKKVAIVLGQQQKLGLLNYVAQVSDKLLALGRELL